MFHYENALSLGAGFAPRVINVQQTNKSSFDFKAFEHTRILIFDQPEGELFIDFAKQKLLANCMYIIPATHLYYYANTTDNNYIIIDINECHFGKCHRKLLYSIKYAKEKLLKVPSKDLNRFSILQNALLDKCTDEEHCMNVLGDSIDFRMQSYATNVLVEGHLAIAQEFLELLKVHPLSLKTCAVEFFTQHLKCSIRTLRRVCFDVFNCSPSYIIKYHLLLYGVYLLAQGNKVIRVSKELGFSSNNSFDRFVKRITRTTPSKLKQSLTKIEI